MGWNEQVSKAIAAIKEAADSEKARDLSAKAKETATVLIAKVKAGAVDAAEAFLQANRDSSSLRVSYLHADLTILSPSDGVSVTRPDAGFLVVADGQDNGLVINAGTDPAYVTEDQKTVRQPLRCYL